VLGHLGLIDRNGKSAYADEWSAYWLYTRVLIAYRDGGATDAASLALIKEAWSANEHVPAILAGTKPPVRSTDGYITMGGADEATDYVRDCGAAWRTTPGAVTWLAAAAPRPKKRHPAESAH